jgi:hypothetical protein
MVEGLLQHSGRRDRLDERRTGAGIVGIELGNIRIVANTFLIPGAVNQNDIRFMAPSPIVPPTLPWHSPDDETWRPVPRIDDGFAKREN